MSLLFLRTTRCNGCGVRLQKHSLWLFGLSILVVLSTIATMGLINVFGTLGFAVVGLVPVLLFPVGTWLFVPVVFVE